MPGLSRGCSLVCEVGKLEKGWGVRERRFWKERAHKRSPIPERASPPLSSDPTGLWVS